MTSVEETLWPFPRLRWDLDLHPHAVRVAPEWSMNSFSCHKKYFTNVTQMVLTTSPAGAEWEPEVSFWITLWKWGFPVFLALFILYFLLCRPPNSSLSCRASVTNYQLYWNSGLKLQNQFYFLTSGLQSQEDLALSEQHCCFGIQSEYLSTNSVCIYKAEKFTAHELLRAQSPCWTAAIALCSRLWARHPGCIYTTSAAGSTFPLRRSCIHQSFRINLLGFRRPKNENAPPPHPASYHQQQSIRWSICWLLIQI